MDDQSKSEGHATVSVVDGEVPDDTWQGIGLDLAALRTEAGEARRRWDASVSTTRSWGTARMTPLPGERPAPAPQPDVEPAGVEPPPGEPRRVPSRDIVVIGRPGVPQPSPPPKKKMWRELFFLGILALTLYGAFQSGRMNAQQRVIVIPIPESRQSVIT